jgi:hypothetical protein
MRVVSLDVERSLQIALQDPPDGIYPHVGTGHGHWFVDIPASMSQEWHTRSSSANGVLFLALYSLRLTVAWRSLSSYNNTNLPTTILGSVMIGETMYSSGHYR